MNGGKGVVRAFTRWLEGGLMGWGLREQREA
jgi:hypothetical protein